jgi:hypothetical protein
VDRFDPPSEVPLYRLNAAQPSSGFAEALVGAPFLVADRLLEAEDRLESEQPQRSPLAVRAHRQREVAEEPLRARADQVAKTASLLLASELELRRVVRHDNPGKLARSAGRLAEVRSQDRVQRDLLVADEPVGGLEFGVIQRLREALCGAFGEAIHQESKAPIQALVAEIGVNEVGG